MSAPVKFGPGAIWSLWDMLELELGRFINGYGIVCSYSQAIILLQAQNGQPQFSKRDTEELKEHVRAIENVATSAELTVIGRCARTFLAELDLVKPNAQGFCVLERGSSLVRVSGAALALQHAVQGETAERWLLSLGARGGTLWRPSEPLFGQKVDDVFPDSGFDIIEAGKCLALDRSTAGVFHLMRAMEGAVRVLGVKLSATVVDVHGEVLPWGVILANIKPKIDSMPKGQEQDEWYKIHALLHSVNRAFRTKTAHPISKYTEEEANGAFAATKAFLQEMAEMAS